MHIVRHVTPATMATRRRRSSPVLPGAKLPALRQIREGEVDSCPPPPTSVPTGPNTTFDPKRVLLRRMFLSMKTRPSTCLSVTTLTRLSTLGGIRRHSEGWVQVPHSRRRTSGCSGGLYAFNTRLHVCRRGSCRHQVREWQLSSAHPEETRVGQAVCGHGIHNPDTP